jgi:glycopeptide antibiotics resistance protein
MRGAHHASRIAYNPLMARSVRTVTIGRVTSLVMLVFVTVMIGTITLWFTGKAYTKVDPVPFRSIRQLMTRLDEGPISFPAMVQILSPMFFNALLFMPWGFLMFAVLDTPQRRVPQSYLLTVLIAFGLSGAIEATQYFLPTRVTDINDVIWNVVGAFLGAAVGHLHRRVRISFE